MLVLSRSIGEEIVIDGQIRISVIQVRGKRVRLGVCAPVEMVVDRQEVFDRRQWGPTFASSAVEKTAT